MTLKDKYKALLRNQKEEREKLKKEIDLNDLVFNKTTIPFKIYIYNLDGCNASLTFGSHYINEQALNKKQVLELLRTFKPLNKYLIGGNSFRFNKDNLKEYEKDNIKEILPYTIKYESLEGYNPYLKIEWFTLLKGYYVEINAIITDRDFINDFCEVKAEKEEFKGGYRYKDTTLYLNGNFSGGDFDFIKWASGTEQQKNNFTIYSNKLDLDFIEYIEN